MDHSMRMTVVPVLPVDTEDNISVESIIVAESTDNLLMQMTVTGFFWFWVIIMLLGLVVSLAVTNCIVLINYLYISAELLKIDQ